LHLFLYFDTLNNGKPINFWSMNMPRMSEDGKDLLASINEPGAARRRLEASFYFGNAEGVWDMGVCQKQDLQDFLRVCEESHQRNSSGRITSPVKDWLFLIYENPAGSGPPVLRNMRKPQTSINVLAADGWDACSFLLSLDKEWWTSKNGKTKAIYFRLVKSWKDHAVTFEQAKGIVETLVIPPTPKGERYGHLEPEI
jgi:hypothetical protein